MSIGKNIKYYRKKVGLTQKQLAEKCNIAEITIRQYETDKRYPKLENVRKIANALYVPFEKLLDDLIIVENITEDLFLKYPELKGEIINNCLVYWDKDLSDKERTTLLGNSDKNIIHVLNDRIRKITISNDLKYLWIDYNDDEMDMSNEINTLFFSLNIIGQKKAVEQVELLTKIPEYRKDEQPILQAAHEDNPTPEQKAAADRIMQDDSEWE